MASGVLKQVDDANDESAERVEEESRDSDEPRSVTELLEQLGRELGQLAVYEVELETARNMRDVRRGMRDGAVAIVAAVALLAAFVFANVAAFIGLSSAMPAWLAALVLAGAWVALGALLGLGVFARVRRWRLSKAFLTSSEEVLGQLERARDDAGEAVGVTLEQLGPALSIEIANAAIPSAGGIVEGVLDVSDDAVQAVVEDLPAGSVVNQIWDVALIPGRYGLRIATTVLRRDAPATGNSERTG
ncbi:MAG TPA: phage holin family protein [Gaiellaceae bacterium]|nr:phage holin family protein [Gaiellaceae bacterium]